jgi:DoxX-like family
VETNVASDHNGGMKTVWVGRALSLLVSLLFAFSAAGKLLRQSAVVQGMEHLGLPQSMMVPLGVIEMLVVVLYLIPRTAILGAILFTGYIGGTIVTHWRVGEPVFVQIACGFVVWLGLYLRRPRLREMVWSV